MGSKGENGLQLVLCLLCLIFCKSLASWKSCARFVFPTLTNNVVTAKEGDTVSLPFYLQNNNCTETGTYHIKIAKKLPQAYWEVACDITITNSSCVSVSTTMPSSPNTANCACLEGGTMSFQFTKTLDVYDRHTSWMWHTTNRMTAMSEITFNVCYAAVITELELNSRGPDVEPVPLERNKSLDVACRWENGNPPVTARLLDRHGEEIPRESVVYSGDHIRYRFPAVGCQDAGLIRCDAPGASHIKTATLLVKCPPEFTDPNLKTLQVNTGTADVTFGVRTHTTMFQYCSVTMAESGGNVPANGTSVPTSLSAAGSFTCSSLTGTPPDLTLTVSMKSIRKQDEGTWRLELANDVGTHHLDFVLAVTETVGGSSVGPVTLDYHTDAPTTKGTTHADEDSVSSDSSAGSSGGGGGGTVAAVVIVLLIIVAAGVVGGVIFYRRRRAQQQDKGFVRIESSVLRRICRVSYRRRTYMDSYLEPQKSLDPVPEEVSLKTD